MIGQPFLTAVRTESDEYLARYLRRKGTDSITMMHKQAVRDEIARRRKAAKR